MTNIEYLRNLKIEKPLYTFSDKSYVSLDFSNARRILQYFDYLLSIDENKVREFINSAYSNIDFALLARHFCRNDLDQEHRIEYMICILSEENINYFMNELIKVRAEEYFINGNEMLFALYFFAALENMEIDISSYKQSEALIKTLEYLFKEVHILDLINYYGMYFDNFGNDCLNKNRKKIINKEIADIILSEAVMISIEN